MAEKGTSDTETRSTNPRTPGERPSAGAKLCVYCGCDVAGHPRVKDQQGRYACKNCLATRLDIARSHRGPVLSPSSLKSVTGTYAAPTPLDPDPGARTRITSVGRADPTHALNSTALPQPAAPTPPAQAVPPVPPTPPAPPTLTPGRGAPVGPTPPTSTHALPAYLLENLKPKVPDGMKPCDGCGHAIKPTTVVCLRCGHHHQMHRSLRTVVPDYRPGGVGGREASSALRTVVIVTVVALVLVGAAGAIIFNWGQ